MATHSTGSRRFLQNTIKVLDGIILSGWLIGCQSLPKLDDARRPNVLFIVADDLRPELGCYGVEHVRSPQIDRLARRGVVFTRAYCQDAVCSPSRTSMLTGLRPDTTRIYDNGTHFRTYHPDVVTLPQQFRLSGYHSVGMGKVFHSAWDHAYVGRRLDDPVSWSEPAWFPSVVQYYFTPQGQRVAREIYARSSKCGLHTDGFCLHSCQNTPVGPLPVDLAAPRYDEWTQHFVMGLVAEAPDVADDALYDGQVAAHAVETLRRIKDRPFFMAVGFIRPHIPSVAPKRYWDLYDPAQLKLAGNPLPPRGAPDWSLPDVHDHGYYCDIPPGRTPIDDALARRLIHGYCATVSYVDAQVGRVLAELERLGLAERTIVVLWGDHGYHLGENSRWGKQTCYEMATRQPLIIAAPGKQGNGRRSTALVEAVDIYPTLCELAELPLPDGIEGASMAPLLDEPGQSWKAAAFSQFPSPVRSSGPDVRPQAEDKMGYALRTDRYRYVEWRYVAQPGRIAARELYDHQTDPGENMNLADVPSQADLLSRLERQLRAGWRRSLPPMR